MAPRNSTFLRVLRTAVHFVAFFHALWDQVSSTSGTPSYLASHMYTIRNCEHYLIALMSHESERLAVYQARTKSPTTPCQTTIKSQLQQQYYVSTTIDRYHRKISYAHR